MLGPCAYLEDRELLKHLGVYLIWEILVVIVTRSKDVVLAHAPRVQLIRLVALRGLQYVRIVSLGIASFSDHSDIVAP
jgi:hypothetical protein